MIERYELWVIRKSNHGKPDSYWSGEGWVDHYYQAELYQTRDVLSKLRNLQTDDCDVYAESDDHMTMWPNGQIE
jgi:hypothetical protein